MMVENGSMIMRPARAKMTNGKALTTSECGTTGRDWKAITNVNRYIASGRTQNNGTAAASVEMWRVTASRSPDGTAASPTNAKRSRQVGGAISSLRAVAATGGNLADRNNSTPQAAISMIST